MDTIFSMSKYLMMKQNLPCLIGDLVVEFRDQTSSLTKICWFQDDLESDDEDSTNSEDSANSQNTELAPSSQRNRRRGAIARRNRFTKERLKLGIKQCQLRIISLQRRLGNFEAYRAEKLRILREDLECQKRISVALGKVKEILNEAGIGFS